MDFVYDESGRPLAVLYSTNGTAFATYYYILNLQGDVVKLIGTDGSIAASYTYDAWGNILSSNGTMANINPLRYRGYYYDSETGYYYLQSRYYDPAIKRFINADVYASTDSTDVVSCNVFAYCKNNPVIMVDPTGEFGLITLCVIGALTYAAVDYGTQVYDNYEEGKSGKDAWVNDINWGSVVSSGLSGAVSAVPGAGGAAIAVDVFACPVVEEAVNCAIGKQEFNIGRVANQMAIEAANTAFMSLTFDKLFPSLKMPKFIRDIKDEARMMFGIRGTRQLSKYLDNKQIFVILYNAGRTQMFE